MGPSDIARHCGLAWRSLARRPAVSLTVIVALALGIGANTAVYTVVDALVLRPLPYPDADRLVFVWGRTVDDDRASLSGPEIDALRTKTDVFEEVIEVKGAPGFTFELDGPPERVRMLSVSPGYFDLYGIPAHVGRTFEPADEHLLPPATVADAGAEWPLLKAVISHEFWERRFGSNPEAVGTIVRLNGREREIVGVMPEGFRGRLPSVFGESGTYDGWYLSPYDPRDFPRDTRFIRTLAKLRASVSVADAQIALDRFTEAERALDAVAARDQWGLSVVPLHDTVTESARAPLALVVGSALLVLLIACANVSTVLLARATDRIEELRLRRALGGGAGEVIGLVLGETAVLAAAGAAAAVGVAWVTTQALVALRPPGVLGVGEVEVHGGVLAFAAATGVAVALLAGGLPGLWASRLSTSSVAGPAGRGTAGSGFRRLAAALVTGEVALALVLTTGAALLVRSFGELAAVDPGFRTDGIATGKVTPPTVGYPDGLARAAFYRRVADEALAHPEVEAFGAMASMPLDGTSSMFVETDARRGPERLAVDYRRVLPGALEVLDIPLSRGRLLEWSDLDDPNAIVAVVDTRFAEAVWPGEDPIGRTVVVGRREYGVDQVVDRPLEARVVGLVSPVRARSLRGEDPPTLYVSMHYNTGGDFTLMAAGPAGRTPPVSAIRDAVYRVDPALPVFDLRTAEQVVAREHADIRYALALMLALGSLGLALAATGVYGVLAYTVGLRRRELSVRAALGAAPGRLLALVARDGAVVGGAGLALGWVGAMALAGTLESLLFGVRAADPLALLAVALVLVPVIGAAAMIPGLRAGTSDPAEALRESG